MKNFKVYFESKEDYLMGYYIVGASCEREARLKATGMLKSEGFYNSTYKICTTMFLVG